MKCQTYFYRLLARKEYSAKELYNKGLQKGFEAEEVTEAIAQLQERGDQSDERLVTNLITTSLGKYGKSVIKRKCLDKGISEELFEQVLHQTLVVHSDDNLSDLKAKVERKYKIETWTQLDPKTKAKIINYLNYRGFQAFQLLRQWQQEEVDMISNPV